MRRTSDWLGFPRGIPEQPPGRDARSRYQFRCHACGRFDDRPLEGLRLGRGVREEIHSLAVVADGVCGVCREGGALASASPRTLRLLTGFLARTDRRGLERSGLLEPGSREARACGCAFEALGRVLASPPLRHALDEGLRGHLEHRAQHWHAASPSAVAGFLARTPGPPPPVAELYALLWSIARREGCVYRTLERRVADRIEALDRWPFE